MSLRIAGEEQLQTLIVEMRAGGIQNLQSSLRNPFPKKAVRWERKAWMRDCAKDFANKGKRSIFGRTNKMVSIITQQAGKDAPKNKFWLRCFIQHPMKWIHTHKFDFTTATKNRKGIPCEQEDYKPTNFQGTWCIKNRD